MGKNGIFRAFEHQHIHTRTGRNNQHKASNNIKRKHNCLKIRKIKNKNQKSKIIIK